MNIYINHLIDNWWLILISIVALIYAYFCLFQPKMLLWAVTNPLNNKQYPGLLITHGVIAIIFAIVAVCFFLAN